MNAFAKGSGAEFILVIQPEVTTKKIKTKEENIQFEIAKKNCDFQKRYKKLIQYTTEKLDEQHIRYIDITNAPEYIAENETIFIDIVHLNAKGHALMADIIDTYLYKNKIINE